VGVEYIVPILSLHTFPTPTHLLRPPRKFDPIDSPVQNNVVAMTHSMFKVRRHSHTEFHDVEFQLQTLTDRLLTLYQTLQSQHKADIDTDIVTRSMVTKVAAINGKPFSISKF